MRNISIKQVGATGYHIQLGEMDVSAYVTAVLVDIEAGAPPAVHLVCVADHIDLPDELQALVTASRPDSRAGFMARVQRK